MMPFRRIFAEGVETPDAMTHEVLTGHGMEHRRDVLGTSYYKGTVDDARLRDDLHALTPWRYAHTHVLPSGNREHTYWHEDPDARKNLSLRVTVDGETWGRVNTW